VYFSGGYIFNDDGVPDHAALSSQDWLQLQTNCLHVMHCGIQGTNCSRGRRQSQCSLPALFASKM